MVWGQGPECGSYLVQSRRAGTKGKARRKGSLTVTGNLEAEDLVVTQNN